MDGEGEKEEDLVSASSGPPMDSTAKDELTTQTVVKRSRRADSGSENGKKKPKEEKPFTKIVVRRLPPTMTKEMFLEQVSPVPPHDYMYYVQGDPSQWILSFSRAYINFINQEDLLSFTQTFDNYVFLDAKGQEYPAIVEFAPYQRIPKPRTKKRDPLCGTIESDPIFIAFKETLLLGASETSKPGAIAKQHYFETEISTTKEVNTTPLIEFLKQRKAEKARIRDERREEKKRKEAERKLKQKAKEKKVENDEEEPKFLQTEDTKEIKLLQPKDRRERDNKKKERKREEKERSGKENRVREFKNRNSKGYQEDRGGRQGGDRREEKKSQSDKRNSPPHPTVSDNKDGDNPKVPATAETAEPKRSNNQPEKRKTLEFRNRKKYEVAEAEGGGGSDNLEKRGRPEKNRSVRKERERKRRDDYLAKKNAEKKFAEMEKRKQRALNNETCRSQKEDGAGKKGNSKSNNLNNENASTNFIRRNSLESFVATPYAELKHIMNRRNSLESNSVKLTMVTFDEGLTFKNNLSSAAPKNEEKPKSRREKNQMKEKARRNIDPDESGAKSGKDPRSDRRIRNKDRPSLQIYRPGMGKFSRQRLEKEKVLGSSTEIESPSHSPSPTPNNVATKSA